jgi:predicted acylesterase/phospholipase RssA
MKIGFCFTGEGARGAVQAGIVKSLYDKSIKADLTIGISSGSVCAASYSYLGPDGCYDMWKNIKNIFSVFGLNINLLTKTGLLNQKPMEKIVSNAMLNDPICESIVSKMNIETGELSYISNMIADKEEFKNSLLASVAITGLVEDRDGWVDAGSRQLAPLKQAIELGCDKVYVIMGRPLFLSQWKKPKGILKSVKMVLRALDITLYEIMIRDINTFLNSSDKTQIYLAEPTDLFYESTEFNKCSQGVNYGKDNFRILNKRDLKKVFKKHHG